MKKLVTLFFLFITQLVSAQLKPMQDVLKNYIGLKNELVAGNAANSKKSAIDLKTALEAIQSKSVDEETWKAVSPIKEKLLGSLQLFLKELSIAQQREAFAALSDQMIRLAKTTSLIEAELYVDYCPMKKASWLSIEKPIKNPYYGNMMLTCGSIKETIKQ